MDFDEAADELYGVHPDEFTAARKAREGEARADGDRALATAIGALPKPSTAAWVVNLLVREHRDEIGSLVELGGLLREAQESLAGDDLKALSRQRNQLLAALSRQGSALARERGHPVSSAIAGQVEETLRAALADPDAGEAVLAGRLSAALSYSGLGTAVQRPDLRVVPPPRPDRAKAPVRRAAAGPRGGTTAEERRRREEAEARRAAEERRRAELAEARRALTEAEQAADEAEAAVEAEQGKVDELGGRHDGLQGRVEELTDELARAREESTAVGAQLARAQRRRQAAGRRAAEAQAARDSALARLDELRDR